jgi:hypothetical protein
MPNEAATRARKASDLRPQLTGIGAGLAGEVVFQHIRTGRNPVTIYSMVDGEPIPVPEYMLRTVFSKTLADGSRMFTDDPAEAPSYRLGEVKCFLHADSAERGSGILKEIGLAGKECPAGHLASTYAKRMHGRHRHSKEWEAYQEYVADEKEKEQLARQERQLAATLSLAGGNQDAPDEIPAPTACASCGAAIEGKLADHTCE